MCETPREHWGLGSRPSACGWTSPATPTGARSASVCPSGSTSSGKPATPVYDYPYPDETRTAHYEHAGIVHGELLIGRERIAFEDAASGTIRGVTVTGGSGVGTGPRSRSGTSFAANVVKADEMEGGWGYVWDDAEGVRPVEHLMLETHLGTDDVPTAARYVINHELEVNVDVLAPRARAVARTGRTHVAIPACVCAYTTSSGTGTGWCEWLQVGLPLGRK